MWKWLIGTIVALAVICGGGGLLLVQSPAVAELRAGMAGGAAQGVEVTTELVGRGELRRNVNAPGVIEPEQIVAILAEVSARVTELPFDEGDRVRAGDVLVRLDDRDLRAQLESARASKAAEEARLEASRASLVIAERNLLSQQAQLEGAQATYDKAKADLERSRQLFESGDRAESALESAQAEFRRAESSLKVAESGISQAQAEVDRARASLNAAEKAVDIAQANIQRVEEDIANTVITSPIDGTVVRRRAELGEVVIEGTLNRDSAIIMEIADLSNMVMRAEVDEANIALIDEGQPVRVYINAYGDRVFDGRVRQARLVNDVASGTGAIYFETEVELDLPPGERLRSGLRANCDIQVQVLPDVVKVPTQAIQDRRVQDLPPRLLDHPLVDRSRTFARVVYTVQDGKAVAVPVRVGSSDLTHTTVEEGLELGTPVIIGPYKALTDLRDGQVVRPRAVGEPAAGSAPAADAPAAEGA